MCYSCKRSRHVQSSRRLTSFQPVLAIGAHMKGHSSRDRTQIPILLSVCSVPLTANFPGPSHSETPPFHSHPFLWQFLLVYFPHYKNFEGDTSTVGICYSLVSLHVCITILYPFLLSCLFWPICLWAPNGKTVALNKFPDGKSNLPWSSPSLVGSTAKRKVAFAFRVMNYLFALLPTQGFQKMMIFSSGHPEHEVVPQTEWNYWTAQN